MVTKMAPNRGHRPVLEGPGFLARADLQVLIDLLREDGRTVVGPTVAAGAIVLDELADLAPQPPGLGAAATPRR